MKLFNPASWYWHVGGDLTQAYSSAVGDFVPAEDQTFLAWKADGTAPTAIASVEELGPVLAQYLLRPVNADVLESYRGEHASKVCQDAAFKIAFNHENRLRAIERNLGLNGSPANLTPAQAVNAMKALM